MDAMMDITRVKESSIIQLPAGLEVVHDGSSMILDQPTVVIFLGGGLGIRGRCKDKQGNILRIFRDVKVLVLKMPSQLAEDYLENYTSQ